MDDHDARPGGDGDGHRASRDDTDVPAVEAPDATPDDPEASWLAERVRVDPPAPPAAGASTDGPGAADADPAVGRVWWRAVLLTDVALGAGALGLLLVTVGGRPAVGGGALVVGVAAAVGVYRAHRALGRLSDE